MTEEGEWECTSWLSTFSRMTFCAYQVYTAGFVEYEVYEVNGVFDASNFFISQYIKRWMNVSDISFCCKRA